MRLIAISALVLTGLAGSGGCGDGASDRERDAAADEAKIAEEKARVEAAAARETQRLADLWSYHDVAVGKGHQVSASIYSTNDVDTDGQGARRVQLVFRDHPSWGRSSYLVLQGGDFACYSGCTVQVTVDAKAATAMAARRPRTDDAIAMFINDERALWGLVATATQLSIAFPVKVGGTRTATFDVAGLDQSKMPKWD